MGLACLWMLGCALFLAGPPAARADGGAVVGRGEGEGLSVTVFAAPVPLRAGPVDLSVLAQDPSDAAPVLDAEVWIELRSPNGSVVRERARRDRATNKLLYAAAVTLPTPGTWRLRVEGERGPHRSTAEASLQVAAAGSPAARFWPWLAFPPAVVAVFVLHQWLRDRASRERRTGGPPVGPRSRAARRPISPDGGASTRRSR